jgi:hypothetical protein
VTSCIDASVLIVTKSQKLGPLLIFSISLGLTLKSILVDGGNPVHAQVHPPGAEGREHPLLEKMEII